MCVAGELHVVGSVEVLNTVWSLASFRARRL